MSKIIYSPKKTIHVCLKGYDAIPVQTILEKGTIVMCGCGKLYITTYRSKNDCHYFRQMNTLESMWASLLGKIRRDDLGNPIGVKNPPPPPPVVDKKYYDALEDLDLSDRQD